MFFTFLELSRVTEYFSDSVQVLCAQGHFSLSRQETLTLIRE